MYFNVQKLMRLLFSTSLLLAAISHAEEGGSGHYQPGSMSSFADGVSTEPVFITRLNAFVYQADARKDLAIPIGGLPTVDADVDAEVVALTFGWVPEWGVLNDTWTFQMSMTLPVVSIDVSGSLQAQNQSGQFNKATSDSKTAMGDIVLMPLMFNQKISADFNINYRLGFYAPTGSYKVGRLANTGKNYWTIEPTIGLMYFGQKNGREASILVGADFNQENSDTNYKTGTQVHIDTTFAQHFPLGGGLAGVGIGAYWYKQIKADSGSGATLGDFKAKATGIGPVLSYVNQAFGQKLVSEFRWLHESGVENRFSGDILYLKAEIFF